MGDLRIRAGAELAGRLRARRGEIEQAIFDRIRGQRFGARGGEDAEYVGGLRAATGASLEYALAAIEAAGEDDAAEPVPAATLEQARRAARVGVGLDTVLRRYVAGYALLEEYIVEELEQDPSLAAGSALRDSLGTVSGVVERLIAAVGEAYRLQLESRRSQPELIPVDWPIESSAASSSRTAKSQRPPASGAPQRERIMAAAVEVVAERGYADATIGMVVERAGVSRRTFYEVFPDGLDGVLVAVMDWALGRISELVCRQIQESSCWRDGLLDALAALLLFFDADRALAHVCFVETLAGATVREHRERNVRIFRALLVEQLAQAGAQVQPLAAEAVMASVIGMVYAHLAGSKQTPLLDLLGPLMSAAIMPFVPDEPSALKEKSRGERLARRIQAGDPRWSTPPQTLGGRVDGPLAGPVAGRCLPAASAVLSTNRDARRARECLLYVAGHPDSSNGKIAEGIGVAHRSQISRLLSELAAQDLVVRLSEGAGKRNAWRLSAQGERMARTLGWESDAS